MVGDDVSRIGELALAWLLTRAEGKGARSDLSRALKPFAEHRWSSGEWSTRLEEALTRLEQGGLVLQNARKGLTVTPEGRTRGLAALGVERLAKGTSWKQLKRVHLVALALGLPPSSANLSRLGRADGMRAVLVQKQLGLSASSPQSLAQVRDALCWRQLGVETDKPFTLAAVQAVLLGRALQASREVAPAQALQQLAARSVGARRTDTDSLRLAALRAWAFPAVESTPAESAPAPVQPVQDVLHDFAGRVLQAARTATSGRFGDDRVFISHVWRAMQGQGLDEQSFKRRLIEANQKRLLSLSRADMVELMDPADVSASEIQHLGATFHFIAL
ncbi:hypothetical protein [Hyalangium rubrum]|uniref:Uncharacterized protein n=1 Tax=Hyalangium rubrum TaxID=3103134 RepID=A0ABU5GXS7_9BACT|nr:hypothetical protein [Hyalangium sp. s54d21]MDY7225896.1 hypothetical protein [Hyalangium sp. s54d21]